MTEYILLVGGLALAMVGGMKLYRLALARSFSAIEHGVAGVGDEIEGGTGDGTRYQASMERFRGLRFDEHEHDWARRNRGVLKRRKGLPAFIPASLLGGGRQLEYPVEAR